MVPSGVVTCPVIHVGAGGVCEGACSFGPLLLPFRAFDCSRNVVKMGALTCSASIGVPTKICEQDNTHFGHGKLMLLVLYEKSRSVVYERLVSPKNKIE